MLELAGKVAVVTGAAGGIGYALAERFARAGARVVLADLDRDGLDAAARRLRDAGHDVAACATDVTSCDAVGALAQFSSTTYGGVHVLCNNAGIGGGAADALPLWEAPLSDWDWAWRVNVWGVIHGVRAFVPLMLSQGGSALIVNTASRAGLMTSSSLYSTTKHAVVALSEALHGQLRLAGSSIEVAVLCPGAVNTNLARNSGRQRPAEGKPGAAGDLMAGYRDTVRTRMAAGQAPAAVAEDLFAGLARGDFYIVPGEGNAGVETRCQNLRARRVEDYAKSYPQFQ